MSYIDKISVNGSERDLRDVGAARFDETQTLTDTQKQAARANVGAASAADVTALTATVATKADASNVTALDGRVTAAVHDIRSIGDYLNLDNIEIVDGSYIQADGTVGSNSSMSVSDFIEIPDGVNAVTVNRTVYTAYGEVYPQNIMVFWYDANKVFLNAGTSNSVSGNLITSTNEYFYNAKYIRVNFSRYNVQNYIKLNYYYDIKYVRYIASGENLDDIKTPGVYFIVRTETVINAPSNMTGSAFMSVYKAPFNDYCVQIITGMLEQSPLYRFCYRYVWSEWSPRAFDAGELYSYSGSFTTTEVLTTDFIMEKNTSYIVKISGNRTGIINVYGAQNVNNYKRFEVWDDCVKIINDNTRRYLCFYNPLGQLDTFQATVYRADSVILKSQAVPSVYRVAKRGELGDYTSLSKCLLDLKNDHAPKTIEIMEGDYDIYAEYKELYDAGLLEIYDGDNPGMDYFDYCVWVPKNTHIIGKGLVRLKWMPDPAEDSITAVQCRCISPLNVAASCVIENVEVYCKNGRYCLHNDGLGKAEFTGATQKYINCRFYKYANDVEASTGLSYGFDHATGFGIDRAMHHVYENCYFVNYTTGRAFYGHSRSSVGGITLTEAMSSDITLTGCILESECGATGVLCKLGNGTNPNLHIRTMFNNCTFVDGWIAAQNESSSAAVLPNAFDLVFNNCGSIKVNIKDTENKYPPKAYRTTMTLTTN